MADDPKSPGGTLPGGKIRTALAGYGKLAGTGAVAGILILVVAAVLLHKKAEKQNTATLPGPPPVPSGPAGRIPAPAYRESALEQNRREEQAALSGGRSFVPSPNGIAPGTGGPTAAPGVPPPGGSSPLLAAAVRDKAREARRKLRRDRDRLSRERQALEALRNKAMLAEMVVINKTVYEGSPAVPVADDVQEKKAGPAPGSAPKSRTVSAKATGPAVPASLLKLLAPGTLYYGEVDTEVNSDVPGPVLATIETGKLRGAKLLGGFTKAGDYVVLKFTSMTLPDGSVSPLTAYALNPHKLQSGMATDVDHHYLERYGSMLLGAFLYGFGQAEMYAGGTTTVTQLGTPVFVPSLNNTLSQTALGLGMAGQQLASVTQQNFNIPSTVHLHQNDPIAILIIRATAPKPAQTAAAPAKAQAPPPAPLPPVGMLGGAGYGSPYGGSPYGYPGGMPMMPMMP